MKEYISPVKHTNLFENGEEVFLRDYSKKATVKEWSYTTINGIREYTYSILELPGTFLFEYELQKIEKRRDK